MSLQCSPSGISYKYEAQSTKWQMHRLNQPLFKLFKPLVSFRRSWFPQDTSQCLQSSFSSHAAIVNLSKTLIQADIHAPLRINLKPCPHARGYFFSPHIGSPMPFVHTQIFRSLKLELLQNFIQGEDLFILFFSLFGCIQKTGVFVGLSLVWRHHLWVVFVHAAKIVPVWTFLADKSTSMTPLSAVPSLLLLLLSHVR